MAARQRPERYLRSANYTFSQSLHTHREQSMCWLRRRAV